ncbi:MAG TPA: UDP-N-acetylmuramoyl-tripeptide--D-alanyl-D-alanine ligase [Verrucomicrobiales bacterium]|nr:UDP-N-acetylmuramoyl-tripeptide--D-alanyl-D-alanine ligase [Verrucomicrobiales bacterium]
MKSLTLIQIADWIGGALIQGVPSQEVLSVSTDSRKAAPGDLFVALKGERFDAHKFLDDVAAAGVAAMLVSSLPVESESYSGGIIRVRDTLKGLQDLAFQYRQASPDLFVVGVTGSNGKTSTKDFLSAVLSVGGRVNKTAGNLNNHIGLPLTILSGLEGDRYGVWEMGMNHPGEIEVLADIARPNAAVITNIGTAHIEFMGTREAIAAEKAELPGAVPAGGYCVMPGADDFYELVKNSVACEMVPVGIGNGVVRAESLVADSGGRMRFSLCSEFGDAVPVVLPVRGNHMVMNALLAAAVGLREGIAPLEIAEALAGVQLTHGRLEELTIRGIDFIDDSYNANPDSMLAALQTVRSAEVKGRRVAVLGFMGELGEHEEIEHFRLGDRVVEQGIDALVTVGSRAARINERAVNLAVNQNFDTHTEAAAFLRNYLTGGDLVLVKGSRSAAMERCIESFR